MLVGPWAKHGPRFIRPTHFARSQHQLPTGGHTSRGRKDVVVAVAFVKLGALYGAVFAVAIEHNPPLVDGLGAVWGKLDDCQNAIHPSARMGEGMDHVNLAIVVPQGAGVDIAVGLLYQHWLRPFLSRVLGAYHVDASVGIAPVDVVPAIVKPERGGPNAVAMLRLVEGIVIQSRQRVVDDLPVHQVARMENRQSRRTVEGGGS